MKKSPHFTFHCIKRLRERTSLTTNQFARIIADGVTVCLGSKPGIQKNHYLFYSIKDEKYYVAIQNIITGAIITVLHMEYHENLAWKISEDEKREAQSKAIDYKNKHLSNLKKSNNENNKPNILKESNNENNKPNIKLAGVENAQNQSKQYYVTVGFLNTSNDPKAKLLGKYTPAEYRDNLDIFIESTLKPDLISSMVTNKGIAYNKISWIAVRIGNNGDPIVIELD